MNTFWPTLVLVYFYMSFNLRSAAPVDYVSIGVPGSVSQAGVVEVLEAIRQEPGLFDHRIVDGWIVAWSVKKEDSNRPPGLLEEVLLLLRMDSSSTNLWALAYVQRDLARGAIIRNQWSPGPTGKGMAWKRTMTHQPAESEVAAFLSQSNFGNNECLQGIIPLHITVYAPFKGLRSVAAKTISDSKRENRFRRLDGVISDPFPLR